MRESVNISGSDSEVHPAYIMLHLHVTSIHYRSHRIAMRSIVSSRQ